jgi:hypothetical protein
VLIGINLTQNELSNLVGVSKATARLEGTAQRAVHELKGLGVIDAGLC